MGPCRRRPVVLVAAVFAAALAAPGSAGADATLLPNLDAEAPRELRLQVVGKRMKLEFRTAVRNTGLGPLEISAERSSRSQKAMRADQVLLRTESSPMVRQGVGRVVYSDAPGRHNWRYENLLGYQLRRTSGQRVRQSETATFCLTDRYDIDRSNALTNEPRGPVYTGSCGRNAPGLFSVSMGLSVGFADSFQPGSSGQSFDITELGSGRYWLVNTADPAGTLLESSEADNSAALLVDLRARRTADGSKVFIVRGLRACPDAPSCPAPGAPPRVRGVKAALR